MQAVSDPNVVRSAMSMVCNIGPGQAFAHNRELFIRTKTFPNAPKDSVCAFHLDDGDWATFASTVFVYPIRSRLHHEPIPN
jgi:hypothetical protein